MSERTPISRETKPSPPFLPPSLDLETYLHFDVEIRDEDHAPRIDQGGQDAH